MVAKEKKKLDKLWSDKVKERDGKKCLVCGESKYINAHHVIGRRNLSLRWDVDNGVSLCPLHHTFGTVSAHQDPVWFVEWFTELYPDRMEKLRKRRNEIAKNLDYDQIKETLK